jgi:glucosamine--fructose-6-phosphate aminotransferase (isomerizing)
MCGIVAARGADAGRLTLDGLRQLEYRGYDSAGLAVLGDGGHLVRERAVGKLNELLARVGDNAALLDPAGELAIGHTRWATHGPVHVDNAHPLTDCFGHIAVVHNGVLDNAAQLRSELMLSGHRFRSAVDSEVVAHLMERDLENGAGPLDALRKTVARLEGAWALAVLVDGFDALFIARHGSPLLVRGGRDRFLVASDAHATAAVPGPLRALDDGDVVELGRTWRWRGARNGELPPVLDDTTGERPRMSAASVDTSLTAVDTTATEIAQQTQLMAGLVDRVLTDRSAPQACLRLGLPAEPRVLLLGCGTSYHAALVIARTLRGLAGLPCEAVIASEYDPCFQSRADLTIAISQSGETADLLTAIDAVTGPLAVITNNVWSSLARRADAVLDCGAGQERGVAATKSFTAQVLQGIGLALAVASARGRADAVRDAEKRLRRLPGEIADADALAAPTAEQLAAELVGATGWLFLGTGSGLPYAAEGALKLKEVTYRWAQSYPSAELKHGPLALVEHGTPVVIVDNGSPRLATSAAEVAARGARVITVGGRNSELGPREFADDPPWGPLGCVPALQRLALSLGEVLGRDVDRPRNLAKSVTVA